MSTIENISNYLLSTESSLPNVEKLSLDMLDIYNNLDSKHKDAIDKIRLKKDKEKILTLINNPKIQKLYLSLNKKTRETLDKMPLRDRYELLLNKLNLLESRALEKDIVSDLPFNSQQDIPSSSQKEIDEQEIMKKIIAEEEEPYNKRIIHQKSIKDRFDGLIKLYFNSNPSAASTFKSPELEVRFGTKGIQPITKNNYENVIKKLKSLGFRSKNPAGIYSLKIENEFLDNISGRFRKSDIRVEIVGLHNVQAYCKNDNLKELYQYQNDSTFFVKKTYAKTTGGEQIYPVDYNDFNFRVAYSIESKPLISVEKFIVDSWKKNKKKFRYMNRVTFIHDDYPFNIDLSIVKYSDKKSGSKGDMFYTINDSNVFNNNDHYEIEIEIDNERLGPGTKFNNCTELIALLRKAIKYVLCGLQDTNYPISYPEQNAVMQNYLKLIGFPDLKKVYNKHFIGPSSKTLQLDNIAPINNEYDIPNIRSNFVVTEKADGIRNLLYIDPNGKIYLINMNMNVIFTGANTDNKDCFGCLLDGELILHDKKGKFINLYAAFDIYYFKENDVRSLPFMLKDGVKDIYSSRYQTLKVIIKTLEPKMFQIPLNPKSVTSAAEYLVSPISISVKDFYPYSNKKSIFSGCNEILKKVDEGRFEYETDGLIFTHSYFGVGSNKENQTGPNTKITWNYSFKWKPAYFNTIDFLVTTIKSTNGQDVVNPIFEEGINNTQVTQLNEYKSIELRCGFNEMRDGYLNPCQDVIDDKIPEFTSDLKEKYNQYPVRFYPSEPYDPKAGLCKIMLRMDESGNKQMFTEENDVFQNDTIVEFRYDISKEQGWRWIPLRIRHDKTAEYRAGSQMYGNSYGTANNNWKSIHYPVTEEMIRTGNNIPEMEISQDVYYNTTTGQFSTKAMKDFHNLYVKKKLIKGVSKPGDTLIDYACGKGGDLPKWIDAKLSFVFGVDYSKDNLENRLDGACARYLNKKKFVKNVPDALFVNGNSGYNIKNGAAMKSDKAIQITKAVFGEGNKDPQLIGKGVANQFGKGANGFNVSSCQFAVHYFFENPEMLQGFLRNVAECTKLNGYFIGTAYDGQSVFNLLRNVKTGESVVINENGKKIWEIIKYYGSDRFEDNSSCINYKICVFQESINQLIKEYLINFDYFTRLLENYGFKLISKEEANEIGLPNGSGMFNTLFESMVQSSKNNKKIINDIGMSLNMSPSEKKISFLNRYFVFQKIQEVNTLKVQLDFSQYNEFGIKINQEDTEAATDVAKLVNQKLKPRIKKLNKKILITSNESPNETLSKEIKESIKINEPLKLKEPEESETIIIKKKKPKKKLIIES